MRDQSLGTPEQFLSQTAAGLVHLALIGGLSALAALAVTLYLRRRGERWTWALGGPALAVPVWDISHAAGWICAVGGALATWLSLRWDQRDREAGGDLALAAAARRGPLQVLRRRWARRELNAGRWCGPQGLVVGRDQGGLPVRVPFGRREGAHVLVVGATGSGKTVTQTWITVRAIEQGHGAIVIDPKGDDALRAALVSQSERSGRPLLEWTPDGPAVYNPYGDGVDTEIVDRALAAERYTEPHYLRQAQRYLGQAVRAMRLANAPITPARLVRYLEPIQLEVLGRSLPESDARRLWAYLDSLTPHQLRDLAGTRDRLAVLAESEAGRWLDPEASPSAAFTLGQAVAERAVVLFRLEADRRPLLGQMLGAAILQDVLSTAARHQAAPVPTTVMVDEFSALAAPQVARLFARTRAAGISLLLGTQELSDLRAAGGDTLLHQVLGNVSALVAHRQVVPDSAELVAGVAGTQGTWVSQQRTSFGLAGPAPSGTSTRSRGREYIVHPDLIKSLAPGVAAVVSASGRERPRVARVFRAAA
ncbi:MAG: hypothetical protein E6G56_07180 [Actinobacteria bacterium]|nr:MAG: hypothetical protein E6G56_07180 [Actinomycetota bacterium]